MPMHRAALIELYRYEAESWDRLMAFFGQEMECSVKLLDELKQEIKTAVDIAIPLPEHTEFTKQRELFLRLSAQLTEQVSLLQEGAYTRKHSLPEETQFIQQLRMEIKKAEECFLELEHKFWDYQNAVADVIRHTS